jgi:hypothetical protein
MTHYDFLNNLIPNTNLYSIYSHPKLKSILDTFQLHSEHLNVHSPPSNYEAHFTEYSIRVQ